MSPEYALDGIFSVKSDAFSFGVVVLEILSGRRSTGVFRLEQGENLLSYVSCTNFSGSFVCTCLILGANEV